MAKKQFGKKRCCPNCGTKFYDLNKIPPKCPACGFVGEKKLLTKAKTVSTKKATIEINEKQVVASSEPATGVDVDTEVNTQSDFNETLMDVSDSDEHVGNEIDDSVMEDTSSIDDEEADVSEVKEHLEMENPIKD